MRCTWGNKVHGIRWQEQLAVLLLKIALEAGAHDISAMMYMARVVGSGWKAHGDSVDGCAQRLDEST